MSFASLFTAEEVSKKEPKFICSFAGEVLLSIEDDPTTKKKEKEPTVPKRKSSRQLKEGNDASSATTPSAGEPSAKRKK